MPREDPGRIGPGFRWRRTVAYEPQVVWPYNVKLAMDPGGYAVGVRHRHWNAHPPKKGGMTRSSYVASPRHSGSPGLQSNLRDLAGWVPGRVVG